VPNLYRVADEHGVIVQIMDIGLACCALEIGSSITQGLLVPAGEVAAGDHVVLVVSGTVTHVLAPAVLAAWESLPEPKSLVSFGACANTGGPYWDAPTVLPGVDDIIPVEVYIPGCPPTPQALVDGLARLAGGSA
jgi:NADH-quinone oxidoreductase subunit B